MSGIREIRFHITILKNTARTGEIQKIHILERDKHCFPRYKNNSSRREKKNVLLFSPAHLKKVTSLSFVVEFICIYVYNWYGLNAPFKDVFCYIWAQSVEQLLR